LPAVRNVKNRYDDYHSFREHFPRPAAGSVQINQRGKAMQRKKQMAGKACVIVMLTLMLMAVPAMAADKVLMMATTTSTDNTGLLDYLAPLFYQSHGNRA
jgi:hypothetical protein